MPGHSVAGVAATAMAVAPANEEDLAAGTIVGEYQIEKKLGEGGMGAVYGARHPLIGKRVAIKVISRELSASAAAVERFVLEAQAVNQIGDQNIVDIFSFGNLPDGRSYFVMEWLKGESLRERLARQPLTPSEAVDFIDTMCKALKAAHEAGIIHRDLKPDNVFLVEQKGDKPMLKLLDFGLAKLSGPGDSRHERTRTGMVMGTPLYLSPEQARGDKVDPATDIYSLGAMAFEMFTGAVPFNADSAVEIMAAHISRPVVPPSSRRPGLPPQVDALVMAMMAKDPRQRPSLDDIRAQLHALRPMFVGVAAPNASTMMAAVPTPHSGPGWGQQQAPSWPAQPAPGQIMQPLAGQSSHPYAQHPRPSTPVPVQSSGGTRGLVIVLAALALIGGGAGVFFAVRGGGGGGGGKVAAAESGDTKPADTKSTETKPAETKPTETKPAESKPAETQAAGTPPAETKPAETKPAETQPAETKPTEPPPPTSGVVNVTIAGGVQATITVDGKIVATKAATAKLELPPGEHAIRVEAPRRKPYDAKVVVDAGKHRDLAIDLPRLGGGRPGTKTTTKQTDVDAVADPFAN